MRRDPRPQGDQAVNKRQARAIAEIVNGSYMAQTDTGSSEGRLSYADDKKIQGARKDLGLKMLIKNGLYQPVNSVDEAIDLVLGKDGVKAPKVEGS